MKKVVDLDSVVCGMLFIVQSSEALQEHDFRENVDTNALFIEMKDRDRKEKWSITSSSEYLLLCVYAWFSVPL